MIDLHCHILPGIDDGPGNLEDSVELARQMADDGVTAVAATPHVREDHPRVVPKELASRRDSLADAIASAGIQLSLITGGEVDVAWAVDASAEDLRLVSFAQLGADLLVETPYGVLPETFEEFLFMLRVKGFRVLLAHPERNPTFLEDPARLYALAEQGVLLQVTAAALTRRPSRSFSARLARELVKRRIAHVVASDSHGPSVAGRRSLAAAREALRQLDPAAADWVLVDVPAAILAGDPIPPTPPPRRRKPLWRR